MTKKELESKSSIDLIIEILQEKRRHLTPDSPLGVRIDDITSILYWNRKIEEE